MDEAHQHPSPLNDELILAVLEQYRLRIDGYHGIDHWARVRQNGLELAARTGADTRVVELFALFHDACRRDEGIDPKHGKRGADLAKGLRRTHLDLPGEAFDLFYRACRDHTSGDTSEDPTVQTCWDADRLDLARVGITPRRRLLCTSAAKDVKFMEWAVERGRTRFVPRIIADEWLPLLRRIHGG